MTPEPRAPGDEELASLLEAYDSGLATGHSSRAAPTHLSDAQRTELDEARSALRMLNEYWGHVPPSLLPPAAERTSQHEPGAASESPPPGAEPAPERLGRFEIIRELGRGGGGIVFLASDPWLDREVALKVPRPEALVAPKLRRRFLREAQAAAGLNHPNVVPVYEVGEDGPICYLTSEYCPGSNLADWLAAQPGPLPHRVAAGIVACLADGAAHAHERGIWHRDIKPSNVLLGVSLEPVREGASLGPGLPSIVPKLSDFGLAKVLEAEGDDTRTGTPLGTPAYMAPEQAEGRLEAISAATDVYGLGTILYELLAGRLPFRGATDLETLHQIVHNDPEPLRRWQTELPLDLQSICLKALAKRPRDRYPSAAELAADLRRFLSGEPTEARPLGHLSRAYRWARRRPLHVALILVSLVAGGLLTSGTVWHQLSIRRSLVATRQAQREAELRSAELRQYVYPGDVQLAHLAWRDGQLERARQLLLRHVPQGQETDLRDFAWHYVWGLCHAEERVWKNPSGDVFAAVFRGDDEELVTGDADGMLRWWNPAEGTLLASQQAHEADLNVVTLSPDHRWLVTASDDGRVRLWDAATRTIERELWATNEPVLSAKFSPDGAYFATVGSWGPVRLWQTRGWQPLGELSAWDEGENAIDISSQGQLAVGNQAGEILLWDVPTRQLVRSLRPRGDSVVTLDFSPDGRRLASGGSDRTVEIRDVASGQLLRSLVGHRDRIEQVVFSPDGTQLASASKDSTARLWQPETGELLRIVRGHSARLWMVGFARSGQRLVTAGGDRLVKLWDLTTDPESRAFEGHPGARRVAALPDGEMLVTAGQGRVVLWGAGGDQMLDELAPHIDHSMLALPTPDGLGLVTAGRDGLAKSWWLNPLRPRHRPFLHLAPLRDLAISPDARWLATAGEDQRAYCWSLVNGQLQAVLPGHWAMVTAVAFTNDSQELASGDDRGELIVTSLSDRSMRLEMHGHRAAITDLVVTPDGSRLISASYDGTIRWWNIENGAEMRTQVANQNAVRSLAISPQGDVLASGGEDGSIVLWSLATGQVQLLLRGHHRSVRSLAFLDAGQTLISVGELPDDQGEVRFWHARRAQP